MQCKCGRETTTRFIQHNYDKAEYEQCVGCGRIHVHHGMKEKFAKIAGLQKKKR